MGERESGGVGEFDYHASLTSPPPPLSPSPLHLTALGWRLI